MVIVKLHNVASADDSALMRASDWLGGVYKGLWTRSEHQFGSGHRRDNMFYTTAVGRKCGIFHSWSLCNESVRGYPGAIFRKWETLHEATQHLNKYGIQHDSIEVHGEDKLLTLKEYCEQNSLVVPPETAYEHQTLFNLGWGLTAEVKEEGVDIYQRDWDTGTRLDRGLFLTRKQWLTLTTFAPRLVDSLKKVKAGQTIQTIEHLGQDINVSVNSPYPVINVRLWEKDKPTKQGFTLRQHEFDHLLNIQHLFGLSFQHG